MKSRRGLLWSVMLLILLLVPTPSFSGTVGAQTGTGSCTDIVLRAMDSVNFACDSVERNEACYGFTRVDTLFWDAEAGLIFNDPADTVPLTALQTIQTSPLNAEEETWGVSVLHLQADMPGALPGQLVTFLLMGEVTLENAVSPEDAAEPVEPVAATVLNASNIRSRPTTRANVVGSVSAGTELQLIGLNDQGDWYELLLEDVGYGWIAAELIRVEDSDALADLPMTAGEGIQPQYGPMQAFYLDTGFGNLECNNAPDALAVQSPEGIQVTFNVNNLEVEIGSTVLFITAEIIGPDGQPIQVLVVLLIEGHVTINVNGTDITLTQPGSGFAITLNENGQVDENSTLVPVPGLSIAEALLGACLNALQAVNVFDTPVDFGICETLTADSITFATLPEPGSGSGGGDDTNGDGSGQTTDGETINHPVYFCEHQGDNVFQWFSVDVTSVDGQVVSETIVGGPYTGGWLPGCPGGEPPPVCGNGLLEAGEACDPPDGTSCLSNCQFPLPTEEPESTEEPEEPEEVYVPYCGNGILDEGEECDPPGGFDGLTCDEGCIIPQ